MTIREHYDDPLQLSMSSTVVAHGTFDSRPSIVLDRTIFYPESGGQMADHGTLGGAKVIDVQLDEEGRVHHLYEGEPPALNSVAVGVVDMPRRRLHMALHTAQHALSGALARVGAKTLSSRLGSNATVDVDRDDLSAAAFARVQGEISRLIDEDRPVSQRFVDEAPPGMRKRAGDYARLRVVEIENFDLITCGGTHVTHTSQIGLFRIVRTQRYKGGTRIFFSAGSRARDEFLECDKRLRNAAELLDCAPPEVGDAITKMKGQLSDAQNALGSLRAQLAEFTAARLAEDGDTVVAVLDEDIEFVRLVAARLVALGKTIALASRSGLQALVTCPDDHSLDCRDAFNAIAAACGGRGGGRAAMAQGKLVNLNDFESVALQALKDGAK